MTKRDSDVRLAAFALTALPFLLAYNVPPSPTVFNQFLSVAAWGCAGMVICPASRPKRSWPLHAAFLALLAGVQWSWLFGHLPAAIGLSTVLLLMVAMLTAWAGTDVAARPNGLNVFCAFAWAVLWTGLLSVGVAWVQVFLPAWANGDLIAQSGLPGRAVGNLRQPNHLCSLLLWAVIAAVALFELGRLRWRWACAAVLALVFAVELSASRTGAAALLLLALWGALGRGMSMRARCLLMATPLLYALSYGAMLGWGEFMSQAFGAEARLASAGQGIESPNTRGRIWANALALIAQSPWSGVGFGEFNLAWSLTEFPGRPTAFFDHTHNLPLQLAVELGLPLAALVMGLLLLALWVAWRRSHAAPGAQGVAAMSATMMVLMIGLHSLVEYPLWYAYFLLPTVFAWGYALGTPGIESDARHAVAHAPPPGPLAPGRLIGLLIVMGTAVAMVDYLRVVAIYAPGASAAPLAERIQRGQHSLLFAYQGDYASATSGDTEANVALAFRRAPHFLLDTRLMIAWAQHLAATGQIDLARSLGARLREFRNADADEFLAVCKGPESAAHFQCQPPQTPHAWREFLGPQAHQPMPAPGKAASPASATQ